jgi:hypothetical protein
MAKVRPRRLVIDADIGGAAGDQADGSSHHCAAFLDAVRDMGHAAVMTVALLAEWRRRRSRGAARWLRSMYAARKVIELPEPPDELLRDLIGRNAPEPSVAVIMLKDCHLIEAALATDRRVVSKDDRARGHFGRAATTVMLLQRICWVNPTIVDEQPLDWLHQGAPLDRHRLLGSPARSGE